jgi:hypothetical protein
LKDADDSAGGEKRCVAKGEGFEGGRVKGEEESARQGKSAQGHVAEKRRIAKPHRWRASAKCRRRP